MSSVPTRYPIITNHQHLLDAHPYQGIKIVRPALYWQQFTQR